MDITLALATEEIAALSDAERTLENAARHMEVAGELMLRRPKLREDQSFEESLRFKKTLDAYEEQVRYDPSWERLSVLVNCEYQLYLLNRNTPLRHNPFLSHWVEAIQRLSKNQRSQWAVIGSSQANGAISSDDINTTRVEMIKSLLQSGDGSQFAELSPKLLHEAFAEGEQNAQFDIRIYVRMLEEEGIYERAQSLEEDNEASHGPSTGKGKSTATEQSKLHNRQQWKQDILSRLETDPDAAISELTHLPIDLSYLDFLTTLLQDRTFQQLSIEPSPVIRDYLQHALRLAEQMGEPPRTTASGSSNPFIDGANREFGEETDGIDHGRAAQVRAVKLLLLFIRNLIRKALLPPEAIYFEIQEICVRYVWIKEVRDFRAFIEEGPGSEQPTL